MTEPAAEQEQQREQTRLALGAMLIPLFFVILFARASSAPTTSRNMAP
jgi:hypothetical protein